MAPVSSLVFSKNTTNFIKLSSYTFLYRPRISTQFIRGLTRVPRSSAGGKMVNNVEEALDGLKDGDTILVGGFGDCGQPGHLLRGIQKRGTKDLTVVGCTGGTDDWGVGWIIKDKLVKRVIASYIGEHENLRKQYQAGTLEIELTPQGTLIERIRAGGAGIPAFYTPCGVGTLVQEGGLPIAHKSGAADDNKLPAVRIASEGRPSAMFDGQTCVLETAIKGDFAFARAWKADTNGNLIFRKTARNYNPTLLTAARVGVVEVEEIVPVGQLKPDEIHLPGIYVDRILLGDNFERRIEKRTVRKNTSGVSTISMTPAQEVRVRIARRVALEFQDGMYANLGIGIPTLATDFIPLGTQVTLQGENGVIGLGGHPTEEEIDPDMTNPSKELATIVPGAAFLNSVDTFAMIRGGHLDLTVLGAMQVSQYGDIANWIVPGKILKGMGGAMDLVSAPDTKVIVAMEHAAKDGSHKIVASCDLPLTGKNAVNMIITEKCVFEVDPENGLTLTELAEGVEIPEVMAATGCEFVVADDFKPMGQAIVDE